MTMAQTGAVSQEEISHARDAVRSAQAALDAAQQELASNRALTSTRTIDRAHPDVLAAAAKVRDAYLDYARNTLPAPVTGYVAQRSVQVGQRVSPGTPLMAVVPLERRVGRCQLQGSAAAAHAHRPAGRADGGRLRFGVGYHGKVVGFSAGTGSAFALLPAQNATGNWIKVVQRLPVRIALDPKELEQHPLRIGLSMNADVDIKSETAANSARAEHGLPDQRL